MGRRGRRAASVPWAVCTVTLVLFGTAVVLRWVLPPGEESVGTAAVELLGFAGVPVVGALIADRLPDNRYGWLLCALGLDHGLLAVASALGDLPGPAGRGATLVEHYAFLVLLVLLVHVFLLFPTGRLPSPGWWWLSALTVAVVLGLGITALFAWDDDGTTRGPLAPAGPVGRVAATTLEGGVLVVFLLAVAAMGSVLVRYRRAGSVERLQLRWFLLAAAVNAATIVLDLTGLLGSAGVWVVLDAATFSLIPVAIGIAVLRYRLYEIDRILSRTVSYTLLTAGLVALYVMAVTALRQVLEPLTGSSEPAVVASTLAVAAAFQPARRRVQDAVDRRFDRARYDATRLVDAYARRLRTDVDLETVVAGLRGTVTATVGPQRMALWLRDVPTGQGTTT